MDVQKKFAKARITLLNSQPFFGMIALGMPVIWTDKVKTMGVDGVNLYANESFVDSLDHNELAGVIAHECLHVALLHPTRRGNRNPKGWNIATDYAINAELKKAIAASSEYLLALPEDALYNPDYEGLSADDIYNRLPRESDRGKDEPEDDETGEGEDDWGKELLQQDHAKNEKNIPGDSSGDVGGTGEVFDAPANMDKAELEAKLKQTVVQAATVARSQGKLPGNIASLVDGMLKPVVDWRAKLREHFERVFPSDYSWVRPNRRFVHQGIYLPGVEKDGTGHIVVGVDTSGSVRDDEIAQFMGEINYICEDITPEMVTVIYCDSKVQKVDEFEGDETFIPRVAGRGGTRFVPVFDEVEKRGIQPKALIYLTDLGCGEYPDTPGYPVIWGATERMSEPPFGEVVDIKI